MKDDSLSVGSTTKYALIVNELRDAILGGRLLPDEQLPAFPKMLERFSVAKHTLEKAYVILEKEGLIRREQGRGIFVQVPGNIKTVEQRKSKDSGFIGYLDLWPEYSSHSPYVLQMQKGMRQAASQANKNLVLIDSPHTFAQWEDLDGLLLCEMGKVERHALRELLPADLPVVNLLYEDPAFPSVVADDAMGTRLLVEHLLSLGHEGIGFLGFHRIAPVNIRYQSYREAMLRHGKEPRTEWLGIPDGALAGAFCKAGYLTMQRWLGEGFLTSGCTALLTQNDQMAYGVMRALQEADISVPGDISVAGFDGVPHAVLDGENDEYWQPLQLTSVRVPLVEIADVALKVLLNGGGQLPPVEKPITLPVELQKGESSAVVAGSYDVVCTH